MGGVCKINLLVKLDWKFGKTIGNSKVKYSFKNQTRPANCTDSIGIGHQFGLIKTSKIDQN